MKKIHLMLAALSFFGSYAQLQNANWHFGNNAAITFLPSPGYPANYGGSALSSVEGCASVSDANGNLLFYTNGETVWDANHQPMPNGGQLNGHHSNTQGAVIVQKPGSPKIYYIITIDGYTGTKKGLYCTEVDMSVGTGIVVPTAKNKVMKDHFGVPINESYLNNSEKLTTTVHSNNQDYWIVAQINNFLYSYRVTPDGVTLTPSGVTGLSVNITNTYPNSIAGRGQLKISPDAQHIGIAYYVINDDGGALLFGDYNNTSGTAVMDPVITEVQGYGIEFSSQSQYVYFSMFADLYQYFARTANTSKPTNSLCRIDMKNRNKEAVHIEKIASLEPAPLKNNPIPTTPENAFQGSFQLALNNKIYVSGMDSFLPNSLTVINAPDSYANPVVETYSYDITSPAEKKQGLPQWVHVLNLDSCLNDITLTAPETLYLYEYKYADYIATEQDYTITENRNITFNAGNYITLGPNTTIMPGSVFHAFIEGCGYTEEQSSEQKNQNSANTQTFGLTLYPNPANTLVTLHANNSQLQHIRIMSLDGKTITDIGIDKTTDYSINVESYSKGIYIVTAQTADGKTYTEKLVIE